LERIRERYALRLQTKVGQPNSSPTRVASIYSSFLSAKNKKPPSRSGASGSWRIDVDERSDIPKCVGLMSVGLKELCRAGSTFFDWPMQQWCNRIMGEDRLAKTLSVPMIFLFSSTTATRSQMSKLLNLIDRLEVFRLRVRWSRKVAKRNTRIRVGKYFLEGRFSKRPFDAHHRIVQSTMKRTEFYAMRR
jgi:hypothetical protein